MEWQEVLCVFLHGFVCIFSHPTHICAGDPASWPIYQVGIPLEVMHERENKRKRERERVRHKRE